MDFDRIVAVDWSASSTPRLGADSIWIADSTRARVTVVNLSTRASAFDRLCTIVDDSAGEAVLIGVDFSMGYPVGTAGALGLGKVAWSSTWRLLTDMIVDDEHNVNNRFEVAAMLNSQMTGGPEPFWGCPPARANATLGTHKPKPHGVAARAGRLDEWRVVERQLRLAGRRPFSAWQLLGAGAVGSQMLLGIPVIEHLRLHAPERVAVWPFTTGLTTAGLGGNAVVVAEVWPAMFDGSAAAHPVRDASQVLTVAQSLRAAQEAGTLAPMFSPELPEAVRSTVIDEEGWLLGAEWRDVDTVVVAD